MHSTIAFNECTWTIVARGTHIPESRRTQSYRHIFIQCFGFFNLSYDANHVNTLYVDVCGTGSRIFVRSPHSEHSVLIRSLVSSLFAGAFFEPLSSTSEIVTRILTHRSLQCDKKHVPVKIVNRGREQYVAFNVHIWPKSKINQLASDTHNVFVFTTRSTDIYGLAVEQ